MVLRSHDGAWVWELGLYPEAPSAPGANLTRLVSRNRIQGPRTGQVYGALLLYLMEPGSLVMERRMLLGIKERAERLAAEDRAEAEAPAREQTYPSPRTPSRRGAIGTSH
jgi:hypothetical protein